MRVPNYPVRARCDRNVERHFVLWKAAGSAEDEPRYRVSRSAEIILRCCAQCELEEWNESPSWMA